MKKLFILLFILSGCAVTYETPKCELMQRGEPCLINHECCKIYYNYNNRPYHNWWYLTRPNYNNYIIVKPNKPNNKPNNRPNKPNRPNRPNKKKK